MDPKKLLDLQASGVTAPLGDVMSGADEAMAAYPSMKDIVLRVQPSKDPFNSGGFSPSLNQIRLELRPGDPFKGNSAEDITKHELQHFVSREEGNLRGSHVDRVLAALQPTDLDNLEQQYAYHLIHSGTAQGEAAHAAQAVLQGGNPNLRGYLAYIGSGGETEARNAPMRDLFPHLQGFAPRQTQDIRGAGVLHYNSPNDIRGQIVDALVRMASMPSP